MMLTTRIKEYVLLIVLHLTLTLIALGQDSVSVMQLDRKLESFSQLGGVTVDQLGFIYVANFHDAVWKISPTGKVQLLTNALYGSSGNTIDRRGDLYQANFYANTITKIDRQGIVSLFLEEGLNGPVGMVFDQQDNLIICNCSGNFISKRSKNGTQSILASGALFNCPNGITSDDDGNHYVTNFGSDNIIKITAEGKATEFAKIPGAEGNAHIVFYKGNFFITKIKTNKVYQLSLSGKYKVLAGTGTPEITEGAGIAASFSRPNGIGVNSAEGILYINNLNGEWQSKDASTIELSKIKILTLTDKIMSAIEQGGVSEGKKAFWEYKNDAMHDEEDLGTETGTLAWRYMSQLNVSAANMLFTCMTEAYPDRWRPWYYLGEVQKIVGQPDKAITYYKKALERDSGNTLVKGKLAELQEGN